MQIDQNHLDKRVRAYLQSSEGDEAIHELANSVLFNIIGTAIMLPISLIAICTIIGAKLGFAMLGGLLKAILTGETFRNDQKAIRENPERTKPLILASIIVGPQGHGLAVGSLSPRDQQRTDVIARKSREFGALYSEGSDSPRDEELVKLLRDDIYHSGRRRKVPASRADGLDLWLFDMEFQESRMHRGEDETFWLAAIVTVLSDNNREDVRGSIVQIPWNVVAPAIHL